MLSCEAVCAVTLSLAGSSRHLWSGATSLRQPLCGCSFTRGTCLGGHPLTQRRTTLPGADLSRSQLRSLTTSPLGSLHWRTSRPPCRPRASAQHLFWPECSSRLFPRGLGSRGPLFLGDSLTLPVLRSHLNITLLRALPGPYRSWNYAVSFWFTCVFSLLHCPFFPVCPQVLGGISPTCSSWWWVGLERAAQPAPEPRSALCTALGPLLAVQRRGGGADPAAPESSRQKQPSVPATGP